MVTSTSMERLGVARQAFDARGRWRVLLLVDSDVLADRGHQPVPSSA
jgi:hypothetical protein